ncbi:TRAM domain-containing protein [Candidatus Woesearchaeota archaeon]|nr:TRAM domain-containing protein [Candidatus Woesearchaeota archaeon]
MRQGGFGGGRDFSGGGRDFNDKVAPVRVGEEVDVTIEAVGAKGDGIAKKEGFVIFVPNASKGDSVRIRITKVLNNMAFAEVAGQGGSGGGSSQPKREGRREEDTDSNSEEAGSVEAPEQQPVDTEDFGEEQ